MQTVGILYICTGPYKVFWSDFYKSAEEFFLNDCKKQYFVFTDASEDYIKSDIKNDNIVVIHKDAEPWPYPTLLRFKTFLEYSNLYRECDYLYFINANTLFVSRVCCEDVFPNSNELCIVQRPKQIRFMYTYERNPKSRAYIPYNCGEIYVQGGFIGSTKESFLQISKELDSRIQADLNNGIIAVWHDESHLNRYVAEGHPARLLSTDEYCNPEGTCIRNNAKIVLRDKSKYFDVVDLKEQTVTQNIAYRAIRKGIRFIKFGIAYLIDLSANKTVICQN